MTQHVRFQFRCSRCKSALMEVERECSHGPPHAHYRCPTEACNEEMDRIGQRLGKGDWAVCVMAEGVGEA